MAQQVLVGYLWEFVIVKLDDIMVYSEHYEDYLEHLA